MADHCCCAHKPKPSPAVVSESDVERWLRDVPNAVIELLPPGPARSDVRAAQHEVARLAHDVLRQA